MLVQQAAGGSVGNSESCVQQLADEAAGASSSRLGHTLQHVTVGPQLQRLSFAYSKCLLCVEGSQAFETRMSEQLSTLFAVARHAGLGLQYFFARDPAMMQVPSLRLCALSPSPETAVQCP